MTVFLYDEGSCGVLRAEELAEELRRFRALQVEVRGEFVGFWSGAANGIAPEAAPATERLLRTLVKARVVDPLRPEQPEREPLPVEIAAERRALQGRGRTSVGVPYNGGVVQWLMGELIGEADRDDCHIILTARLLSTFTPDDHRWHAHTVLLGEPHLISTTGIVQAPARPREYYQGQAMATTGLVPREVVEAELQRRLADRMLTADDPRITSAALGLALQAVAYQLTGEAFCPEPTCRLFNARRQEELIRSQCSPEARLCARHEALFATLPGGVDGRR